MADTSIGIANPTAGTNRTTGTLAMWVKRSKLGSTQYLYSERYDGSNMGAMYFTGADNLSFVSYDGGSTQGQIVPSRVFRDTSAWYHLCFNWDTTISSPAADRMQVWVNGVRETVLSTNTEPAEDTSLYFGLGSSSYPLKIGDDNGYFDGLMSHVYRVDNQALPGTTFGSIDATTGEFKLDTAPSITYTGSSSFNFFIMEDGNGIIDQSGEGNDLTLLNGTLTNTEDCPDDVFACLNVRAGSLSNNTLSNGNTSIQVTSGWRWRPSTLAPSKGKFYYEVKMTGSAPLYESVGVVPYVSWKDIDGETIGAGASSEAESVGYTQSGTVIQNNSTQYTGTSYTIDDVVCVACDLDNRAVYFRKNGGSWENSGDPESGASKTGAVSLSATLPDWSMSTSASGADAGSSINYGNGYFGTTAITSAGTNASNIGLFEYDVPANYTALSLKGMNS